jgi:hypothetical protein
MRRMRSTRPYAGPPQQRGNTAAAPAVTATATAAARRSSGSGDRVATSSMAAMTLAPPTRVASTWIRLARVWAAPGASFAATPATTAAAA